MVKRLKVKESLEKIREMSDLELKEKLSESKEELFNLRFQLATGHLEDYSNIKRIKKQISRIFTLIREKELGITVKGI